MTYFSDNYMKQVKHALNILKMRITFNQELKAAYMTLPGEDAINLLITKIYGLEIIQSKRPEFILKLQEFLSQSAVIKECITDIDTIILIYQLTQKSLEMVLADIQSLSVSTDDTSQYEKKIIANIEKIWIQLYVIDNNTYDLKYRELLIKTVREMKGINKTDVRRQVELIQQTYSTMDEQPYIKQLLEVIKPTPIIELFRAYTVFTEKEESEPYCAQQYLKEHFTNASMLEPAGKAPVLNIKKLQRWIENTRRELQLIKIADGSLERFETKLTINQQTKSIVLQIELFYSQAIIISKIIDRKQTIRNQEILAEHNQQIDKLLTAETEARGLLISRLEKARASFLDQSTREQVFIQIEAQNTVIASQNSVITSEEEDRRSIMASRDADFGHCRNSFFTQKPKTLFDGLSSKNKATVQVIYEVMNKKQRVDVPYDDVVQLIEALGGRRTHSHGAHHKYSLPNLEVHTLNYSVSVNLVKPHGKYANEPVQAITLAVTYKALELLEVFDGMFLKMSDSASSCLGPVP